MTILPHDRHLSTWQRAIACLQALSTPHGLSVRMTMCVCPTGGNRNGLKEAAGDRMARQRTEYHCCEGRKKIFAASISLWETGGLRSGCPRSSPMPSKRSLA